MQFSNQKPHSICLKSFFPYPEDDQPAELQHITIRLTPEQERRLRAVLDRGAYKSVEEVVEAALTAVEQRTVPGFAGTPEELDSLLAEGVTRELPISTCARGYITLLHGLCRICDGPDQVFGSDRALSQRSLA